MPNQLRYNPRAYGFRPLMRGAFVQQQFPLPSVTGLAVAPNCPAAAPLLAAQLTSAQGPGKLRGAVIAMRPRLSGASYLGATSTSPAFSFSDTSTWMPWASANPMLVGAIALGAFMLLGKKGR